MSTPSTQTLENKTKKPAQKWIFQTLLLSGCLNLIFLGIFFHFLIKENPFPFEFEYRTATAQQLTSFSHLEECRAFARLPLDKLIQELNNKEPVEDGYLKRDISLGFLGSVHHIDTKRALHKPFLPERFITLEPGVTLTVFPSLTDADFQNVIAFLKTEKWPFTSHGLFELLGKRGVDSDATLVTAFLQTPEWAIVEALFNKTSTSLKKRWLLSLVLEGKFETLATFLEMQKKNYSLDENARQQFLLTYLKAGSKTAAALLLVTDRPWALRKLDDGALSYLLDLLPPSTPQAKAFAKEILSLPRSDAIHEKARLLAGVEKKEVAQIRPPRAATGELRPKVRDKPPSSPSPSQHIIQHGETLWTIAKKHKTSVDELKKINHLATDKAPVGKTLKLPSKKG